MANACTTDTEDLSPQGRRAERATRPRARAIAKRASAPFDVELFDLSSTGFRMITFFAAADRQADMGQPAGPAAARSGDRRADGNSFGCEFVYPLHPSVAAHMQSKLR